MSNPQAVQDSKARRERRRSLGLVPLRLREQRATIEDPTTPLDAQNLERWLGGSVRTRSGADVSEDTALKLSAVKACVSILAESVATLPLLWYVRRADGGRERADTDAASILLHEEPNPDMTPATFKEELQRQVGQWGNGLAAIEHDASGNKVALWPLEPALTRKVARRDTGEMRYVTRTKLRPSMAAQAFGGGDERGLVPEQVLHVPGLGNGQWGLSPIGLQRESLGLGLGVEQWTAEALARGAWLASVLEHPGSMRQETYDRLKQDLDKRQEEGVASSGRPVILEDAMKLHQLELPGDDALFLGLRTYQVRDVARWYRVPLHMLADMEKGASFASVELLGMQFVTYTLGVWLAKWEQEATRKLGNVRAREKRYASFLVDAFMRGNTKERSEVYGTALNTGWLTVNEVRRMENLPPVPGGDVLRSPLNMQELGSGKPLQPKPGADAPPVEPEDEEEEQQRNQGEALVAECQGILLVEADRVERKANGPGFLQWSATWLPARLGERMKRLQPILAKLAPEREARLEGVLSADLRARQAELALAHGMGEVAGLAAAWRRNAAGLAARLLTD